MRQITTHTNDPETCPEKVTCLDDDAGIYAIEIEQVGLVGNVLVEGHRSHVELAGDGGHCEVINTTLRQDTRNPHHIIAVVPSALRDRMRCGTSLGHPVRHIMPSYAMSCTPYAAVLGGAGRQPSRSRG